MTSHSLCPLSPFTFAAWGLGGYLGRVKILRHAFSLLTHHRTKLPLLEGTTVLGDAEKQCEPGVYSAENTCFLTVVEWPHVIIPATGGPTSCCCKEGQAERLCEICILTGRLCHCTNRQTNNTLKDRWTTPCFVPSGGHTPVTIEDWQIYNIVLGTSSVQTVLREQHQSIVLKTGRCHLSWQMGRQHGVMLASGWTLCYWTEEQPATPCRWTEIKQTNTSSSN